MKEVPGWNPATQRENLYCFFAPVSLDMKKENWIKAIEDDGLIWHNVSDLKYWNNEAAQDYAVSSIPSNVLIDENGTIIAKNLRGEDLRKKVEELLK